MARDPLLWLCAEVRVLRKKVAQLEVPMQPLIHVHATFPPRPPGVWLQDVGERHGETANDYDDYFADMADFFERRQDECDDLLARAKPPKVLEDLELEVRNLKVHFDTDFNDANEVSAANAPPSSALSPNPSSSTTLPVKTFDEDLNKHGYHQYDLDRDAQRIAAVSRRLIMEGQEGQEGQEGPEAQEGQETQKGLV